MENTMKSTAVKVMKRSMVLCHFNEEYADRLEEDIEELNILMASLNEQSVYDYTCRNNNVSSIYRATT
jgi:hypothetical protein